MKKMKMLVILLRDVNCKVWSQDEKPTLVFTHYSYCIGLCRKNIVYNANHVPSYCKEYSTMKITIALIFGCLFYSSANIRATSILACNADLI